MDLNKFISYDVDVKGYVEIDDNRIGIDFHANSEDVNKQFLHHGIRNAMAQTAPFKYDVHITGKVKFEAFGEIDIDKEFKN